MMYLGDNLEIMRGMEDNSVDLVFTSPPYNRKRNDKYNDFDDRIDDYFQFLVDRIDEMIRISRGLVFVNIQKNYYNKRDVYRLMGHYHKELAETFVWQKSNPQPTSKGQITNAYEFVFAFGDRCKCNTTTIRNHLTTNANQLHSSKEHRAMMHPEVVRYFLKYFSDPKDVVFDPFMGLGTTAVVCEDLGRKWIGCEISPHYHAAALMRIKKEGAQCRLKLL